MLSAGGVELRDLVIDFKSTTPDKSPFIASILDCKKIFIERILFVIKK